MIEFYKIYKLKNLVKGATCYKNSENPSCIELSITLLSIHIIETVTVIKLHFKKQGLRFIDYRDYKRFNTQNFCPDIFANLHEISVTINQLEKFLKVFKKVFDINAPYK